MGRVTYPYANAVAPLGADGTCDQVWNGSAWALTNVTDAGVNGGDVLATACYDPVTKLIYLFGNWDFTGSSSVYNTLTDDYTAITTLPSNVGGNDTFACVYGSNCFIFGGGAADGSFGFSNKILTYPINASSLSQSYVTTSAVVPFAGKDLFGAIDSSNANLVYFGGGNQDISDPPTNSTCRTDWLLYDMSTPNTNPVAKTSLPVGLCQCACVDIGSEILLIGGSVSGAPNTCGTNTVRVYNKAGNSWSTRTNYPINVACARATFFGGVIYCAGGFNATGFDINADPPNATDAVYKSSDLGVSWQLHSSLVDVSYTTAPYIAQRGAKASGGSILVAQ